jgi:hypothetical protein
MKEPSARPSPPWASWKITSSARSSAKRQPTPRSRQRPHHPGPRTSGPKTVNPRQRNPRPTSFSAPSGRDPHSTPPSPQTQNRTRPKTRLRDSASNQLPRIPPIHANGPLGQALFLRSLSARSIPNATKFPYSTRTPKLRDSAPPRQINFHESTRTDPSAARTKYGEAASNRSLCGRRLFSHKPQCADSNWNERLKDPCASRLQTMNASSHCFAAAVRYDFGRRGNR